MTASAADSKISNPPVTFESNRNRLEFESSHVPIQNRIFVYFLLILHKIRHTVTKTHSQLVTELS